MPPTTNKTITESSEKRIVTKGKSTLVQMRLQPETILRVERLKEIYNTDNRTKIVAKSLDLAETILDGFNNGRSIVIELPNGEKCEVLLVKET